MALALNRRREPEPAEAADPLAPSAEFVAGRERWRGFLREREAANHRVAQAVAKLRSDERTEPLEVVQRELEVAQLAREAVARRLGPEREEWDAACRAEVERIGAVLQPRHRAAVKRMAEALTLLCAAIAEEQDTRAELRQAVPGDWGSCILPDCSSSLWLGRLDDFNSPASQWNRDMICLGML
jgi:hypothetical protein